MDVGGDSPALGDLEVVGVFPCNDESVARGMDGRVGAF